MPKQPLNPKGPTRIMPLVSVVCHCCCRPFNKPDYRVSKTKSGLEHCGRSCLNGCPDLHRRTRLFTCEWAECQRIYSPEANAAAGELRSTRWCSYDCKKLYKECNGRLYVERSDRGSIRSKWETVPCKGCDKSVTRRVSENREFVYCSRSCYRANGGNDAPGRAKHTRRADSMWETRDYGVVPARITSDGYIDLYIPIHPRTNPSTRTVRAHRVVMEENIGRMLEPYELVHHKDGDRQNNDLSNLELCRYYQPPGQRVEDQVAQARAVIARYGHLFPEVEEASSELGLASDSGAR